MQAFLNLTDDESQEWTVFDSEDDDLPDDETVIVNFSEEGNDHCLSCSLPILSEDTIDENDDQWCACDYEDFAPASVGEEISTATITARDGLVYWLSQSISDIDCESCQFAYTDRCPFVGPRVAAITEGLKLIEGASLADLLDDPLNSTFVEFWRKLEADEGYGIKPCGRFTPFANAEPINIVPVTEPFDDFPPVRL